MMTHHEKMVAAFEESAEKRGYSLSRDDVGLYEDQWLQEAWEVFAGVDFNKIN